MQTLPPFEPSSEDVFYGLAKEDGFRARSAYKLMHVNEITQLFHGVTRAVDLCAAPGSWSQLLARELGATYAASVASTSDSPAQAAPLAPPTIVAVDLQEMAPIPGVHILQGDITLQSTSDAIISKFGGQRAQLVVCDGAPDVTGLHRLDEFLQSQLMFAALGISTRLLERGGAFCAKMFAGDCVPLLVSELELLFHTVQVLKPSSSRARSAEHFIVGQGYRFAHDPARPAEAAAEAEAALRVIAPPLGLGAAGDGAEPVGVGVGVGVGVVTGAEPVGTSASATTQSSTTSAAAA